MPNDSSSDGIHQKSPKDSPGVQEVNAPPPPDNPSSIAAQTVSEEAEKADIQQIKDRVRQAEKWMIWLTAAIAFFALCTVGVGILQWHVMSGQLGEMKNGSADTRALAVAAGKQADAAKIQSEQAKAQTDKMTESLTKTDALISEAKIQAEVATAALKQSAESFRIDERAWVEIEPIKPTLLSLPDDKFPAGLSCSIYPKNVGKTVARDIRVKAVETIRTGEFSPSEMQSFQGMLSKAEKYTVNIGTNQTTESVADRFPSNPVPKVISPNTVASAPFRVGCQATTDYPSGGHAYSFIVGRIDYCDTFSIRHWKTFCFFVANARGDVWNCQEGNEEDGNTETATPETSCQNPS